SPWVIVQDVMILAVNASVHSMNESIPASPAWVLQKGRGEDALAARRKHYPDRVIHAARHDRFDAGAVRPATEHVGGARGERAAAGALVGLFRERTLTPVNPAIRALVRPVQIVRAVRKRLTLEPLGSQVGHASALGIREFPNARRRRHVERAGKPH